MPSTPPDNTNLTVKKQRDARRAEKVAGARKREAALRRNRRIAIALGVVAAAAVVAVIVTVVATSATPKPTETTPVADGPIAGLIEFGQLAGGVHVDPTPVDYQAKYGMDPPAGGDHWAGWLNCGVYTEPQENERAVHALEHGAVWVTYDPDALSAGDIETVRAALPDTYIVLSPYPGLPAPVVASAWGYQVQLDGPDDPRLTQFVTQFWQAATAPEPGAPCTGAIDGPGRVG